MPGRKTDVSDAAWLAQLGAHGLVRSSFVPPAPIRELRDLTRTRTALTRDRAREVQRLEKLLEDAGIKLSAVASDIVGVSGRAMLEALVAGQRDPLVLAELAKRRMRSKIPELTEALTGRFGEHHAFLVRTHLDLIDHLTGTIDQVTTRIEEAMAPFRAARDLIVPIPGVSTGVADVIIAETGADMARFPTAGHLASWAGTCPGANESAGRVKSTHTRPANPYLKGALGAAAMAAAPRAPLREGLAGRVWVDLTRPADSLAPGQVPAQEARWPGDAKRVMSAPVSAMITSATPVLMPGTVTIRSRTPRKGAIASSMRVVT